jgi:hypothetical protein
MSEFENSMLEEQSQAGLLFQQHQIAILKSRKRYKEKKIS